MRISENFINNYPYVKIEGVSELDIVKIFDCGQCFRFERVENSAHAAEFSGVAYKRFVSFAQDGDILYIYGSDLADFEAIWRGFLDLDRDYAEVERDVLLHSQNSALLSAIDYGRGIRILAQEPFECIISFIISQNNNIPRIKKIIGALSERCGEKIELCEEARAHLSGTGECYSFPSAEALCLLGESGLFELKTGFRAKYIYDASVRVRDGALLLDSVREESDTERAIELLCEVKGIGRKVASCALLFGFGKYDAFPIDVWMKRVSEKYFGDEADSLSSRTFGEYAGIAQQYLFYYERWNSSRVDQ